MPKRRTVSGSNLCLVCADFIAVNRNRWTGGELTQKERICRVSLCRTLQKDEVGSPAPDVKLRCEIMRIAPLQNEPGLIAYERPACDKMTSELLPGETDQSDSP
jgi:hypothetical protein